MLQKRWDSVAEQRTPSVGPALPRSRKKAILDTCKSRIDSVFLDLHRDWIEFINLYLL